MDRYQEAVRALVAEKQKTHGVTRAGHTLPAEAEVTDLMEALRRSLAGPASAQPADRRKRGPKASPAPQPEARKARPRRTAS